MPRFDGTDSVLLATGILGATVMPHVIYLHSALTAGPHRPRRRRGAARRCCGRSGSTSSLAMGLAGLVNPAMLVLAARLFLGEDLPGVDTLEGVHAALGDIAGAPVAFAFAVALLASGFASAPASAPTPGRSSCRASCAGASRWCVRRGITLAPALVVLAAGVDPTQALVLSQVVL